MSFIVFILFLSMTTWSKAIEWQWPVFFEHLGDVHSIHNKWDLALRVSIRLPALEAKVSKIMHRLDLLNSDFHDPDDPLRSRTSIPSRLDDLNRSWKEQNHKIRIRCHNIKRRAEDLRELGEHSLYKRRRRRSPDDQDLELLFRQKRQQFVSTPSEGFLKALFGLAYVNDVDTIKSKLNNLDNRLSSDINGVRSQTNNFKVSTQEVLNSQRAEIRKMEKIAGHLERKVITMETNPFIRTSISDLVHVRNEAYKRLALEVDLVEERLIEIETIVTSLGSGKLSKSILSPKKLKETLRIIENQLPHNYSLLFGSNQALWPYYSKLGVEAVFDNNLEDVVVTMSIPLVDRSSVLQLHRVHNLPLKVKDGYSVIADIDTQYLVTDESKEYYLELFKDDFQDCRVYKHDGGQHFYCGLQPMLKAEMARSCVMQLFQGQTDPAWCQSRLRHGLIQPYSRLYNGSWIFAAMTEQVDVVLQCDDGDTPTALVGFGVIQLEKGCTITSNQFWYSHTHADKMEIQVSIGDNDQEFDTDLDGDPEDYDMSQFEDDIMFRTAEDLQATASFQDEIEETTQPGDDSATQTDTTESRGETVADSPNEHQDSSAMTEMSSREVVSSDELNVQDPASGESATFVYKDLLVKLKDKLSKNWIAIA